LTASARRRPPGRSRSRSRVAAVNLTPRAARPSPLSLATRFSKPGSRREGVSRARSTLMLRLYV